MECCLFLWLLCAITEDADFSRGVCILICSGNIQKTLEFNVSNIMYI